MCVNPQSSANLANSAELLSVIGDHGFWNSMARENRFKVLDHFLRGGFSMYSHFTISREVIYHEDEFLSFPCEKIGSYFLEWTLG